MKKIALLVVVLFPLFSAQADSVLYHATSDRDPWRTLHANSMFSTCVVHQAFTPRMDKIEAMDIGYVPQFPGAFSVAIRAHDISGPILAFQEAPQLIPGPFGRLRVVFPEPIEVIADAEYFIEISTFVPIPSLNMGGQFLNTYKPYLTPDPLYFNGLQFTALLDFGVGVRVPDILPSNQQSLVFREGDSPVPLFPNAVLTNGYITNAAHSIIEVRDHSSTLAGGITVDGVVFTDVFFEGLLVGRYGSLGGYRFSIVFNGLATPAAVQDVVRRILYVHPGDSIVTEERSFSLIYSNASGQMIAPLHLQVLGENDPPPARLVIPHIITFWPDTNRFVFTPVGQKAADVLLDLGESYEPDPDGSS